MRLPELSIAAAFACGAVLGQSAWFAKTTSSHLSLIAGFAAAAILITAGVLLTMRDRVLFAGACAIASWLTLGVVGAGIAEQPRSGDHILSLIGAGTSKRRFAGMEHCATSRRACRGATATKLS